MCYDDEQSHTLSEETAVTHKTQDTSNNTGEHDDILWTTVYMFRSI